MCVPVRACMRVYVYVRVCVCARVCPTLQGENQCLASVCVCVCVCVCLRARRVGLPGVCHTALHF